MTRDEALEVVQDGIVANVGVLAWEVLPLAHLVDELGFDELDFVELALSLEKRLSIELPDSVTDTWGTVDDVVTSVMEAVHKGAPAP